MELRIKPARTTKGIDLRMRSTPVLAGIWLCWRSLHDRRADLLT